MSDDKENNFTVKAVINNHRTRVVFAEFDNNFADILLCFSTRPFGLVMQAFMRHFGDKTPVVGRLIYLYGAEKRNVTFSVSEIMAILLCLLCSRCRFTDVILGTDLNWYLEKIKPEAAGIPLHHLQEVAASNCEMLFLKLTFQKSTNKLLFAQSCKDLVNYLYSVLTIPLATTVTYRDLNGIRREARSITLDSYIFGDEMFMISDDLSVTRFSLTSSLSLPDELKVSLSDVKVLEFQIGTDEVLSIPKASLTSTRAVTDGLINPRLKKLLTPKQEK